MSDNQPEGAMHAMVADLRRIFEACANNSWRSAAFNQVSVMSQLTGGPARAADPKRLHRAYAQVYSQGGADGYLAELFRRIGMRERTFLEIGVGNGLENNTRLLLEHGWTGIWIEGDITQAKAAAELFAGHVASGALRILPLMVTRENINAALDAYGAPPAFALISIDVDINTSHIWRALDRKARVCCIEYNASVPPAAAIEVTYDPHGQWDGTNYFGAGLKVMEIIGRAKGMALVGCDLPGINAYFATEAEVGEAFCAPFTAENHYELPQYNLVERLGHPPSPCARAWRSAED